MVSMFGVAIEFLLALTFYERLWVMSHKTFRPSRVWAAGFPTGWDSLSHHTGTLTEHFMPTTSLSVY